MALLKGVLFFSVSTIMFLSTANRYTKQSSEFLSKSLHANHNATKGLLVQSNNRVFNPKCCAKINHSHLFLGVLRMNSGDRLSSSSSISISTIVESKVGFFLAIDGSNG